MTSLIDYPEHARLIGVLVSNWNSIEFNLVQLTAVALGTETKMVFPMVYAVGSSSGRLKVMTEALEHLAPKCGWDPKKIRAVLSDAEAICKVRNRYAHAVMGVRHETQGTQPVRLLRAGDLLRSFDNSEVVTVAALEAEVERSMALSQNIGDLIRSEMNAQADALAIAPESPAEK